MRTLAVCAVVAVLSSAASVEADRLITSARIKDGTLQKVDLSEKLRRQVINVAQRTAIGPQGVAGSPGPAGQSIIGPAGPTGATGPPGISGYTQVTVTKESSGGTIVSLTAPCGERRVLGGGATLHGQVSGVAVIASWPDANAWSAVAQGPAGSWSLTVTAVCAMVQ
jgi:hypothetical protein